MHHEHSLALGEFLVEISTVKKKNPTQKQLKKNNYWACPEDL